MSWFIHLSIHSFIYLLSYTDRMLGCELRGEECAKMNMLTGILMCNLGGKYDQLYESTENIVQRKLEKNARSLEG